MPSVLTASAKDLGELTVARILPHMQKKMVGPFIFFDHIGPARFTAGQGVNVRPHPHIGLATLTYLFSGSLLHRDSLGTVQEIFPGDVNWMTAGNGIVHSERETLEVRAQSHELHGLQCWIALPPDKTHIDPSFTHLAKNSLPCILRDKVMMRLIAGDAFGQSSPIRTYSPMFYVDVLTDADACVERPERTMEAAIYIIDGSLEISGQTFSRGDFILLEPEDQQLLSVSTCRYILLGGEKFSQVPYVHWNFVAYDKAEIDAARKRWEEGKFPAIPGDDKEYIPLPARSG